MLLILSNLPLILEFLIQAALPPADSSSCLETLPVVTAWGKVLLGTPRHPGCLWQSYWLQTSSEALVSGHKNLWDY